MVGANRAVADNEIIEKMVAEKNALGWQEPEVTQKAFMDITIGDQPAGRLVINVRGFDGVVRHGTCKRERNLLQRKSVIVDPPPVHQTTILACIERHRCAGSLSLPRASSFNSCVWNV